jgi:hypothetical protein
MNGKIGLRILSALILIAAIAGIAFFAFQAGVVKGSPVTIEAPAGQSVPVPPYAVPGYGYGYGMRFHHPFGLGFGCFGILIPLFLFFIAMRAFRFAMWGSRWGWGHHQHGPWGRHGWGERGVPPMFDEWHKKAHEGSTEQPEEKKE